jgi:cytochrome c-type biogenesis protein CcmH/NrfG
MPPRVYHHDHTAAIRARLAQLAITGAVGLLLAVVAAAVIVVVGRAGGPAPDGLVRTAWISVAFVVALSVATLALSLVAWVVYRRRRADLDAQGAEAMGELLARLANRRKDNQP